MYIACPKCDWRPDGGAYWVCTCRHVWDTFGKRPVALSATSGQIMKSGITTTMV
jgi:hypothetical protein